MEVPTHSDALTADELPSGMAATARASAISLAASEGTDADLMAAVCAGDRDSFGRLVDRYKDGLVGYLTRLTGCPHRAEDLAQDAFLSLYQHADRYDERGHLQAFLYRIATNRLRSEERREKRWRGLVPMLTAQRSGSESAPAPRQVLADEAQRQLSAAVAELPMRFRVPLVLHEIEGWPYADIAATVGCREGTVKSRIFRGRQRLRQRLAPYFEGAS